MCTSDLVILAVFQVIGCVSFPFATIDSTSSLSVSVGVHVCACSVYVLCVCNCSGLLVSTLLYICWCVYSCSMFDCAVFYVPLQGLGYFLNLFSLSIPIPWCVSQTLPAHIVALFSYIPPLLILGTVIVYIIW